MIDQLLHAFQEAQGVRQFGMGFERRLVDPARVDPEQKRIADGAIGRNRQAAWFGTRRADHIAQRRRDRGVPPLAGMEAGEDEELHRSTPKRGQRRWRGLFPTRPWRPRRPAEAPTEAESLMLSRDRRAKLLRWLSEE